jgi:hypothetical protein
LSILSFFAAIAPIIITVAVNWGDYIKQPSDAMKLSIGGIIVLVLLFMKTIGKLKMPAKRVVGYMFALILCYLLSEILKDIVFLLAMATLGEVVDLVFFQRPLKKMREQLQLEKTGDAVSTKIEGLLEKYLGGNGNAGGK